MILAFDLDGVFASFNRAYWGHLCDVQEVNLVPTDADVDNPPCWDWDTFYGYTYQTQKRVWEERIMANTEFWLTLDPLPGAPETLRKINNLTRKGHEIYFISNRKGQKVKSQSEKWLYENGVDYPTVLIAEQKARIVDDLGAEFFIDDKVENVNAVWEHADAFRGACADGVFLKSAAYNQVGVKDGVKRVETVREAMEVKKLW